MIKRSAQRFECLALVRYVLRICMLWSRNVGIGALTLRPVTFALFGFLENALGLLRMFNIKKQSIKLGKFSNDRQKQMLSLAKTQKQTKDTKTIANWNLNSRIEYGPQYMQPAPIQNQEIAEEDCSSVEIKSDDIGEVQPH